MVRRKRYQDDKIKRYTILCNDREIPYGSYNKLTSCCKRIERRITEVEGTYTIRDNETMKTVGPIYGKYKININMFK